MKDGKLVLGYMPEGTGTMYPFDATFDRSVNLVEKGFDGVDAIVLWGGSDIAPEYYKQKPHRFNEKQHGPSERDRREWNAMKYAKIHNIPIIGVCRGAQFLCVASGGSLVQHVSGHTGGKHNLMFTDAKTPMMETTSCHHQMLYPWRTDYQLLAWAAPRKSLIYQGENERELTECAEHLEPEVVYFPKTRGLAIQGHPEWMNEDEPFVDWCNKMVRTLLLNQPEEALV